MSPLPARLRVGKPSGGARSAARWLQRGGQRPPHKHHASEKLRQLVYNANYAVSISELADGAVLYAPECDARAE